MNLSGTPLKSSYFRTASIHRVITRGTGIYFAVLFGVLAVVGLIQVTFSTEIGVTGASGKTPAVSSTGKRCRPGAISAQPVEDAVWQAITEALQHPELLAKEYQQRIAQAAKPASIEAERKQMTAVLKRVKAQEDRVTDAYVNEAMGLDRYKAEMEKLRQKCTELERCVKELDARQQQEQDGRKALKNLDRFCHQVSEGLETMTFEERQQLLRLLVERVTVEEGRVRVETVIPTEHDNVRNRYPERVEGR